MSLPPGHCILEILICPTTELGDDKVNRRQECHPQLRFVDQDGGAISVAWGHRHHGPAGKALSQICRDAMAAQEFFQRSNALAKFPVNVDSGAGGMAVGGHRQAADQQQINGLSRLGRVLPQ
jgi:hypothetical protein